MEEPEDMANSGEKFLYFIIGGFVGAAIGLLLAPKTGEETRAFLGTKYREGTAVLGEKARHGREAIAERSREVSDKVSQTLEKGREMISRQREQISAAFESGKEVYEDEKRKQES
jgi:gas vesicle protein